MTDASTTIPAGVELVGDRQYCRDGKGRLVPLESVKAQDRLQDDTVRELFAQAEATATVLAAFKAAGLEAVDTFLALLLERYGASPAGEKGNVSLLTFDGLLKVQVQVADLIEFGAELQAAKALLDECLQEWAADIDRPELRALIAQAFDTSKTGTINRAALFTLLRIESQDPRWLQAMDAIRDSIRVTGSKRYLRFASRAKPTDAWVNLPLNISAA